MQEEGRAVPFSGRLLEFLGIGYMMVLHLTIYNHAFRRILSKSDGTLPKAVVWLCNPRFLVILLAAMVALYVRTAESKDEKTPPKEKVPADVSGDLELLFPAAI